MVELRAELPAPSEDWRIGLVVGPSGSGKTLLARRHFGESLIERFDWPADRSILDGFSEGLSIKKITQALTAVGFSSPPAWFRPYQFLSNGERFRCDLARALLSPDPLVVFDEFTSVVDRTVAKIGSAALSKAIRRKNLDRRFVAVTCHYDVAEWLQPDWILDMASRQLARGSLQRPEIVLSIAPVHSFAWLLFRQHHYLSGEILRAARCFAAFWGDRPIGFSAWTHAMTKGRAKGDMREHRTVVLPDFQGVGIGSRLSEFCASIFTGIGARVFSTTSHPAVIAHRITSPLWRCRRHGMVSSSGPTGLFRQAKPLGPTSSVGRITAGFQYVGPPMPREQAAGFLALRPRRFPPVSERLTAQGLRRMLGISKRRKPRKNSCPWKSFPRLSLPPKDFQPNPYPSVGRYVYPPNGGV